MDRIERFIVVVLSVLVIVNLAFGIYLFALISSVNDDVDELDESNDVLSDQLLASSESDSSGELASAHQTGPLVGFDNTDGSGIVFEVAFQPLPSDRIYIDTKDLQATTEFQNSMQDALAAVSRSDYEPAVNGFAVSMDAPDAWKEVGGESAGLPIAAHLAATNEGYTLNTSVAMTGAVEPDGSVMPVGDIRAKAIAAAEEGKDIFIAPPTSETVDVDGIEIIHVRAIDEAFDYALDA